MDGQTDVQIPPVFYRTLSPPVPPGAAAQKQEGDKKKPVIKRQEMVIGTLALLWDFLFVALM